MQKTQTNSANALGDNSTYCQSLGRFKRASKWYKQIEFDRIPKNSNHLKPALKFKEVKSFGIWTNWTLWILFNALRLLIYTKPASSIIDVHLNEHQSDDQSND